MTITEALLAEHAILKQLFDHVEAELSEVATLESLRLLARLIERLLHAHGEAEEELVLCALDHSLEHQGRRDRFHQDHQELDDRFRQILATNDLATARRLMHGALTASRKHFEFEEESLFPLVNEVLGADMLLELGQFRALARHRAEANEADPLMAP